MSFKPAKTRSVVLKKGRVLKKLSVKVVPILTIIENPVESLGKIFDDTFRDKASIRNTCGELEEWMKKLTKLASKGGSRQRCTNIIPV